MEHYEFNWLPIESFDDQSTKNLLSDFNKKVITKNRLTLLNLQKQHVTFLEDLEDYNKNKSKNLEEGIPEPVEYVAKKPDFAICCTDPRDVWRHHYPALFIPHLVDEGECWKTYHCFDDEYPTEDELKNLKGIIVPGNVDSPLDEHHYLVKFKEFIARIYTEYPSIKLVGSCAGHQLITIALGGEVSKAQIDDPITIGKFKIDISNEMNELEEFRAGFGENYNRDHIYIIRSHGFYVTGLPPDATALASSDFGDYDIYHIGDRVLSFQPHPEFTEKFVEYHILKRILKTEFINEEYYNRIKRNLYDEGIHNQGVQALAMVRAFLKKSDEEPPSEEEKDSDD